MEPHARWRAADRSVSRIRRDSKAGSDADRSPSHGRFRPMPAVGGHRAVANAVSAAGWLEESVRGLRTRA